MTALFVSTPVESETLTEAMAAAYANNPSLNAARAGVRATDEGVPQALSGFRPTISAFASAGTSSTDSTAGSGNRRSASAGITVTQPVFSGFRTVNGVKAAEAAVRAARESLRNTEQNTLLDAVTVYMNVVRERSILNLREANYRYVKAQVTAASDRLAAGDGTRTDVAQAEARLAAARSEIALARANLEAAAGTYRQVIGREPGKLAKAKGLDSLVPRSFEQALAASRSDHPAIRASQYNADVAGFNVSVVEGELLPTVTIEASAQRDWERGFGAETGNSAQIVGRLNIPIYEGGQVYSRVREAKEVLGQRRIEVDVARDQVQAALYAAWGGLEAARAQVKAARSQVEASRLALEGVEEEQRVGQRTTLDVLNAQNEVVNAQIALVQAERDSVVASYSVIASIGRLSSDALGLKVPAYKAEVHYAQVRDKWFGLRTPAGE
nr:TolC family outer membrane protein [Chthonobacter albigriseus]